jgi:4a-hydroxytetrahydrobiopterin dehydratase
MKLFSPRGKPLSRTAARNAVLINQLATPGLGSLLCGRWIAGSGQLMLAVAGFTLFVIWFVKDMFQYYGQITGDVEVRPIGGFLVSGLSLFGAAWLWSLLTSFSLLREAAAASRNALESFAAPPTLKFGEEQILRALESLPDWKRNGDVISRTFQLKDFPAAIRFVQAVALAAEQAWHHPDIDIRWNKVTLTLTTHDSGGLTGKDFALARLFDKL